jgi:hypothetical protein
MQQVRLASGYPCLGAGGGMILRAIGSWVGSRSFSGSLLPLPLGFRVYAALAAIVMRGLSQMHLC